MNKGYGWKPDLPDQRDFIFAPHPTLILAIPSKMDLRSEMPPVVDQGELGSCTANALAGAVDYEQVKRKVDCSPSSRLFIYYNERVIEDSVGFDSGAMLRDGIKTLAMEGVCIEDRWPYDISRFTELPPDSCYADAAVFKIVEYRRVTSLRDLKASLAAGYPVAFGFTVYDSFESPEVAHKGIVPMPGQDESVRGGHAVLAVGYDDLQNRIIVRNSWGAVWGMDGYFTMPYAYIEDRNLSDDFWQIRA